MKSTRNWRTGLLAGASILMAAGAVLGCNALLGTDDGEGKQSGGKSTPTDADDPEGLDPDGSDGEKPTSTPDASSSKESTVSTGPGPYGALPTGYCCTKDDECRERHCVEVGSGGKMCLDGCHSNDSCTRDDLTSFTCSSTSQFQAGWCQPPTPSFKCIDQELFERGTKASGACCSATYDGNAGQECEGNICGQWGQDDHFGPFICTNWCEKHADCTPNMYCLENLCVPQDVSSYDCQ